MATLPQLTLNFNRQIKITNDGGSLSSDTGELIFREFAEKIGFSKTLVKHFSLNDTKAYFVHSNESMLLQKIYQVIASCSEDDAANQLTSDPVFTQIIGTPALAYQPSLSRFFGRFDPTSIEQLQQVNQELLDKVHSFRDSKTLIFDLDFTHSDTYGRQESATYNAHYRTVGFHPLVAFDGVTGDFLKAKLRPGNVYTSNGVVEFVEPLIDHYNEKFPETSLFVRGDSGFSVPALYELCERESVYYVIRLKSNAQLQQLAEEYRPSSTPSDVSKAESYVEETIYQAKSWSWSKARKVIIQSVRPAGELFFRHSFQVKEAKMMISLLAYNLTNWLRTLSFPPEQKNMQIETIRTRLIKVASKVVKSGQSLYFKLSSSFVYQEFFWNVLGRIQHLQIE